MNGDETSEEELGHVEHTEAWFGFPVLTRAYDNNGRCPRQKLVFGILQLINTITDNDEIRVYISLLFLISPLFRKKFRTSSKIFPSLPFPEENFNFNPPKFLTTFVFSRNFLPIFPLSIQFPPFREIFLFLPTFPNFTPNFVKFTCFYKLCVFRSPYFHHDAFMHCKMHVLDTPANDPHYVRILHLEPDGIRDLCRRSVQAWDLRCQTINSGRVVLNLANRGSTTTQCDSKDH